MGGTTDQEYARVSQRVAALGPPQAAPAESAGGQREVGTRFEHGRAGMTPIERLPSRQLQKGITEKLAFVESSLLQHLELVGAELMAYLQGLICSSALFGDCAETDRQVKKGKSERMDDFWDEVEGPLGRADRPKDEFASIDFSFETDRERELLDKFQTFRDAHREAKEVVDTVRRNPSADLDSLYWDLVRWVKSMKDAVGSMTRACEVRAKTLAGELQTSVRDVLLDAEYQRQIQTYEGRDADLGRFDAQPAGEEQRSSEGQLLPERGVNIEHEPQWGDVSRLGGGR